MIRPRVIQSLLADALRHHQAGRPAEAERIYRRILERDPRHADSLHLLGVIANQAGRRDAALEMIRNAIAVNPEEPSYHSNLGTVLQAAGKLDEAAACYARALALQPGWAEVHSNLGNILQAQGKLDAAVACQERALTLKPEFAEAWSNLGNTRHAQGKYREAVACFERALALKPDFADAHNNLGSALAAQDRIEDAMACYQRALVLKPEFASAYNNLGNAFLMQDRLADAMAHYESALVLKPDYADPHYNLGRIYKEQGKFEMAMAHYDRAIAIRPDYAEAHFSRAEIKSFHSGDPDLTPLEALAAGNDLAEDKAPYIHFALAKAFDDCGNYVRAFEHLSKGNALKRRRIDYQETDVLEFFDRISSAFDSGVFDRLQGVGDSSQVPVFVLSMPRSGSTLIEQILAGHPQIQGAGELTALEMAIGEVFGGDDGPLPYPEFIRSLDGLELRRLSQAYLARLPVLADGKLRIVDKMPGNFLRIGLIRLMLPNARIIHTMRHPIDTCVSCYSKLFTYGLHFSYDLAELGRYYCGYKQLMNRWRSALSPDAMLDVSYEDVVDDLEGQARRLIEYCGLPWNDRCLYFDRTCRPVKTASAVQVRKPLFRTSLQRWRRYEAYLAPLLQELERQP